MASMGTSEEEPTIPAPPWSTLGEDGPARASADDVGETPPGDLDETVPLHDTELAEAARQYALASDDPSRLVSPEAEPA